MNYTESNKEIEKRRLIWVDALKGILMILVVLGHAIQAELGPYCEESHLWNLIYSFHMPAFMAISGWLFYKKPTANVSNNYGGYLKSCVRRCYQLLVPYLIWSLLVFLLRGTYTVDRFYNIVYMPDSYFWFLWVLFGICVIFSGTQEISAKLNISESVTILTSCTILLGVMVIMDLRTFGFQFLAYYFLFYTLGYMLHKYESLFLHLKHPAVLFLIFALWCVLAWNWTMHGLPSWMSNIPYIPSSLLQYAYRGFTALLAVIFLLLTTPIILNRTNKFNRFVCIVGNVSLGIYVIHLATIGYLMDGIHIFKINSWGNIVMAFFVALILSLSIVMVLKKNKLTSRYLLGKL